MSAEPTIREQGPSREASASEASATLTGDLERRRLLRQGWSEDALGSEVRFGHRAARLIHERNGRVAGIITPIEDAPAGASTPPGPDNLTRRLPVRTIPLSGGAITVVDDADYARLSRWRWKLLTTKHDKRYAYRTPNTTGGKSVAIYMHREILGLSLGDPLKVDHANGDGLDNRRVNLRLATHAQNLQNMAAFGGTSPFKGVSLDARTGRWVARLKANNEQINIGAFDDEAEAALAYDCVARGRHGHFAVLNFPDVSEYDPLLLGSGRSRFKGVSWDRARRKWRATIQVDGRKAELGRYENEADAARAYDDAARIAHGDRARLNFPGAS